jgi:hypothetical protein
VSFEQPLSNKGLTGAQNACVEVLKLLVAHHNHTVTHQSRSRKALHQSVSNHVVRTERNKFDGNFELAFAGDQQGQVHERIVTSKGKFTDEYRYIWSICDGAAA